MLGSVPGFSLGVSALLLQAPPEPPVEAVKDSAT